MDGGQALIILGGVLFLLGYCEQMDFIQTFPNQTRHLFLMLDAFRAGQTLQEGSFFSFKRSCNQKGRSAIQGLPVTHFIRIKPNRGNVKKKTVEAYIVSPHKANILNLTSRSIGGSN